MSASNLSKAQNFSSAILGWFEQHGRKQLPWQKKPEPYRVWVSEIMLQQTQVNTVIPYYEKFMQRFPDVHSLAAADEDLVLHHWTGLGYYARARNLHKTAKIIQSDYQGVFPDSVEQLNELPGIGKSTAGAILALASNKRAVILDGNVKRVLCRYHCVEGWPDQSSTLKRLWQLAEQYTPETQCRAYTQAMMDLGATVCTRSKPLCTQCPIQTGCQAYLSERCADFPQPKPRKKLPVKSTQMLILLSPSEPLVLLEKRPPLGIWGGLWSFPELPHASDLQSFTRNHDLHLEAQKQTLPSIRHTFSHFHLDISPMLFKLNKEPAQIMENLGWHWYDLKNPQALGLAAPVKTLLETLEKTL